MTGDPNPSGAKQPGERQARLAAEGWVRRSISDEPRLSELADLYRETGFDVRLEPLTPDLLAGLECTECMLADPSRFRVIYTRPAAEVAGDDLP